MNKDLRTFPNQVRKAGPNFYVEINQPLKLKYETWVIQEKLAREGRFPVIYYPKIEGSALPVISNLFSSWMIIDATEKVGIPFPSRITPPEGLWESMRLKDYIKDYKER